MKDERIVVHFGWVVDGELCEQNVLLQVPRREQGEFLPFAVRFPFLLFCLKILYCDFETEGRPRTTGARFNNS
jgi:hypothetical protein